MNPSADGRTSAHAAPDSAWYRETQRFRHLFIWAILGGVAMLFWWMALEQLIRGNPVGDNPATNGTILVNWLLFGIGLPLLFLAFGLRIRVAVDGVHLRFLPFPGRIIPWHEIADAQVITYRPLRDFGGWGLRYGRGGRRAYTVSGNRGVELTLSNGKRIVIGSRRSEELHAAIQRGRTTAR